MMKAICRTLLITGLASSGCVESEKTLDNIEVGQVTQTFQIIHDDLLIGVNEFCGFVVTVFDENRTFAWKKDGEWWPTEYPHHSMNFDAPSTPFTQVHIEVFEYVDGIQSNYAALTLTTVIVPPPYRECYNQ